MTAVTLTTNLMGHFLKTRYLIYPAGFIILISGLYIFFSTVHKAFTGSWEAAALLVSFTALIILVVWLIRSFWRVILDDSDMIDVFRTMAATKRSKVEPVFRRVDFAEGTLKEHGYRFCFKENTLSSEIGLVHIEPENAPYSGDSENTLHLLVKNTTTHPFNALLFNPHREYKDSLPIRLYAFPICQLTNRILHPTATVITEQPDFWHQNILNNAFIRQDLNLLFMNYRMHFILMDGNCNLAVKPASMESLTYDAESYYVLRRLSKLITDQYKSSIHERSIS